MPFVFSCLSFGSLRSLRLSRSWRLSCLLLVAAVACRAAPGRVATLHDDFGRAITVGPVPRRIVSLNPTTTDILFAIGAGGRIVGRSEYDVWPDSAKLVPSLGGALRPSVEAVLRAKPDLVILYASADNRGAAAQLAQAGVPTVALRIDHLAQFRSATRLLGRIVGDSARAETVVDTVDASLDRLRVAARGLSRPTVFVPVWENPVITVGGGSFMTELLAIGGARNIYDSLTPPSAPVALEDVIRRNPDFVLATADQDSAILKSARWRALPAVRAGRVLAYDSNLFARPSVQMGMAAWAVARLVHPELRSR